MLSQEAARQEFVKGATVPQVTDLAVPCLQAACGVACLIVAVQTHRVRVDL